MTTRRKRQDGLKLISQNVKAARHAIAYPPPGGGTRMTYSPTGNKNQDQAKAIMNSDVRKRYMYRRNLVMVRLGGTKLDL